MSNQPTEPHDPIPDLSDYHFLSWVHERLANIHFEDRNRSYMHKLRAIIARTPRDQRTPAMTLHELALDYVAARMALRTARANRNRLKCEEAYSDRESGDYRLPCWKDKEPDAEMCETCKKRAVFHEATEAARERVNRADRKLMRAGQKAQGETL